MNKTGLKILSGVLCTAVLCGGVSAFSYAAGSKNVQPQSSVQPEALGAEKDAEQASFAKDETVYVIAGADGSVQKIIVSDWIKNELSSAQIRDSSELSDVKTVKGNNSYTMNSENMRVWDAQGGDVYYQGDIAKELPVDLRVSYTLDGNSVAPDQVAGKSGKVTIRFDYKNNQYEMVEIDGKQEKIYVPFAMLTGMILDNDRFRNIEVSNGKIINDGERTIIAGLAFPGLQEDLGLDPDVLKLPDYVEISADVQNFDLMTTMTLATNEIFSKANVDDNGTFDNLSDSVNQLTDAMDQLLSGSSALYDGFCTLSEKSQELISGIDQLVSGAKALKDGSAELDAGAEGLQDGAAALLSGLNVLSSNSAMLNSGAKQVFDALLSTADAQIAGAGLQAERLTADNYADVLDGVIASLDESTVAAKARDAAYAQVSAGVRAEEETVRCAVTDAVRVQVQEQVTETVYQTVQEKVANAVRTNVLAQVLAAVPMTPEEYEAGVSAGRIPVALIGQIEAEVSGQMGSEVIAQLIASQTQEQAGSDAVRAQIAENTEAQMRTFQIQDRIAEETENQIKKLIDETMQSEQVQSQISEALSAAKSGAASLSALKGQLDSYRQFYNGLLQYTAGVDSAAAGAGELKSGTDALKDGTGVLKDGAAALADGMQTLADGSGALIGGIDQLKEGTMRLCDGLKQLNEEGIEKLSDAVHGDLGGLLTRAKAVRDVSQSYQSFSGISDNMEGNIRFIYRTASIQAEN